MALDRRQEQQQHSRRRDSGIVDTEDVRAVLGAERKRCSSSRGSEACDTSAPPLETSVRDYAESLRRVGVSMLAGLMLVAGMSGAGGLAGVAAAAGDGEGVAVASMAEPTSSVTVRDLQGYDGFEDYAAQGQQMENSDVGCFANECKRETASCFTDGSCLKVRSELFVRVGHTGFMRGYFL